MNVVDEKVLERFARLIRSQRLAHAYLFFGPKDIGKAQTALAVAKLVNCEDNQQAERRTFCGTCASCRKIDSGNHPDVALIESGQEASIKIVRIRELIERIILKPFEGRKKVIIIKEVEDLTMEGANALLKTLEEPPKDSLLLLTTCVLEKNLSTIRSRCHVISFFPISRKILADRLAPQEPLDKQKAFFLAGIAEGCPGRAQVLEANGFFERQNEIIDNVIFAENNEAYINGLLTDKEKTQEALSILLSWFRDVMLLKAGGGHERIFHADREQDLHQNSNQYSFEHLQAIIAQIVYTMRMLNDNLNAKIAFQLLTEKIWLR